MFDILNLNLQWFPFLQLFTSLCPAIHFLVLYPKTHYLLLALPLYSLAVPFMTKLIISPVA